jgi:tetratricopeptide (TPR) repeat protein
MAAEIAGVVREECLMAATATEALRGKRVAFTGRLACMTRAEAVRLVRTHGGTFTQTVNERTSILVVGQEGWPLQADGRLTSKLQKVQKLQRSGYPVEILQEHELICGIGLDPSEGIRRLYTTTQLIKLLGLSRDKLRSWIRAGLIQPVETVDGLDYFAYSQIVSAKTLAELAQAGAKLEAIRRSLEQMRTWMPGLEEPLAQLTVLERNGELLVRVDEALIEPSGQRLLDFGEEELEALPFTIPQDPKSAEAWFELGCEHEDARRYPQAAESYRQALLVGGPDRDTSFNLANVLYAMGYRPQAIERYYQALELDQTFVDAWVNLGIVLREQNHKHDSRTAFEAALKVDPHHPDALYNLADLFEWLGQHELARQHWQAYLHQDPASERGSYARQRLALRNA